MIDAKPLDIMFDIVDWFFRDCGGIKYLVLFDLEKYDAVVIGLGNLLDWKVVLHMLFLIVMEKLNWFRLWFASRKNIEFE